LALLWYWYSFGVVVAIVIIKYCFCPGCLRAPVDLCWLWVGKRADVIPEGQLLLGALAQGQIGVMG
jgi:hypothetical protein